MFEWSDFGNIGQQRNGGFLGVSYHSPHWLGSLATMQISRLCHSLVALCMVLASQTYAYVAELHDSTKPNQVCTGIWADNYAIYLT